MRHLMTTMALALVLGGCVTTVGSRTVPPARFNYNEAVALSWNEQLLLNLVRSRYHDTNLFIEVSSILATYSVSGSGTLSATIGNIVDSTTPSASLSYSEAPSITYTPLQGEAFARRVLSPISPETIGLLAGTGWDIETLLLCCAELVNDLHNASRASGPTPTKAPRYEDFHRASSLLSELHIEGGIDIVNDVSGKTFIEMLPAQNDHLAEQIGEVKELLSLGDFPIYNLVWDSPERGDDEIAIKGRSLFGILSFLANGVEPPAEHEARGLVTVTRDDAGHPFDWSQVTGRLIRIPSSKERPEQAYIKIRYRDHWFYIDDRDLETKKMFNLLTYLFALQSVTGSTVVPTLTVSAGGG